MNSVKPRADALVFFGAAGDLAYKKIFPALQAMARRGKLDFPVVGVARAGWSREQLIERAKASVTDNGGLDPAAFPKLAEHLCYVNGQYDDPATYQCCTSSSMARRDLPTISPSRRACSPASLNTSNTPVASARLE